MNPDTPSSAGAADRLGPLGQSLQDAELPACVRDAGGRYVAVNAAFAELVGLEAARIIGKTDNALQPADVAHRVAELDALVLEAHGHLDANETVLAREGRRTVRACRFPVYYDGEVWAICVVMAPGEDPESGRHAREQLQARAGQTASAAADRASSAELLAERDRASAADAEAHAAREALALEREARIAAEISVRTAGEQLAAIKDHLAQSRAEASRLDAEREEALVARRETQQALEAMTAARDRAGEELDGLRQRLERLEHEHDQEVARSEWLAGELTAVQERERKAADEGADQRRRLEELQQALDSSTGSVRSLNDELATLRERTAEQERLARELDAERGRADDAERALTASRERAEELAGQLTASRERAEELAGQLTASRERAEELAGQLTASRERAEELAGQLTASRERAEELAGQLTASRERAEELAGQLTEAQTELSAATARLDDDRARAAGEHDARVAIERDHAQLRDEHERLRGSTSQLEAELAAERERTAGLEAELAASTEESARAQTAEVAQLRARIDELEDLRAGDEHRFAALRAELESAREESTTVREESATAREQAEQAARDLTEARERAERDARALAATEERIARAEQELTDARDRAGQAEQELAAAREQAGRAEAAREAAQTAHTAIARELEALHAARPDPQAAIALEHELERVRAQLTVLEHERDVARQQGEMTQARIADLIAARDAALRARDEATDALADAGAASSAENGVLREQLTAANTTIDELRMALTAERGARENLERKLAEAGGSPLARPQGGAGLEAPAATVLPLPSLAVAAEQARRFAQVPSGGERRDLAGITDETLTELEQALARAASPRSAGRATIDAVAKASGWVGGALWQPQGPDDRSFGCTETWTAHMSRLEAWETMAWRAHLEDGLVPAAAGSGDAHWAATEDALACPRSRAADWAELKTLVTVPVAGDDGDVLAVIELVKREAEPPDPELLRTLTAAAARLAARLVEIAGQEPKSASVGRM